MSVKIVVKIRKNKDGTDFRIDRKNWFPAKAEHDAAVWLAEAIHNTLVAMREKAGKP